MSQRPTPSDHAFEAFTEQAGKQILKDLNQVLDPDEDEGDGAERIEADPRKSRLPSQPEEAESGESS